MTDRRLSEGRIESVRKHAIAVQETPPCKGCYGCDGGGQFCYGDIRRENALALSETILALIEAYEKR